MPPSPRTRRGIRLSRARPQNLDAPCAAENQRLAEAVSRLGPLWLGDITIRTEILHLTCPPPGHGGTTDHVHPFMELTYMQAGGMDYYCSGRRIPVKRGEIFCMTPDTPHHWLNRTRPSVLFGFMLSVSPASNRTDSLAFRLAEAISGIGYRIRGADSLAGSFEGLRGEVRRERSHGPEAAVAYIRLILTLAFRHLGDYLGLRSRGRPAKPGKSRAEQLFLNARAFIEANVAYGASLAEVASHLGITPRHLNRIYRKWEGIPVGEAIARVRLEKARALLSADPETPVKRVALLCGFSDVSYFCRFFRERTGTTPGEFSEEASG